MKKFLISVLILVAVTGVCIVTCPDKASHAETLKNVVNTALNEELSDGETDSPLVMLGTMIGSGIGGLVIDNMLKVDDYFVCSVGTMSFDGETKVVSVGILNHVFTPDKEDLKQAVRDI